MSDLPEFCSTIHTYLFTQYTEYSKVYVSLENSYETTSLANAHLCLSVKM